MSETSSQDWYGPFLNATQTHSPGVGLQVNLPFAIALVAACRMLRAPVTALLPAALRLPESERTTGLPAKARYIMWLLVSALIGIASHLAWDSFTHGDGFLVTHVQPLRLGPGRVHGRQAAAVHEHRRRPGGRRPAPLAAPGPTGHPRRHRHRCPAESRHAVERGDSAGGGTRAGAAVNAREDFNAYRYVTEVDYSQPTTVDLGDGVSDTTYPSKTVQAPWGPSPKEC
ncbi:DUF4184 family protein [Streptomyces sp. M10(2022)]